jgi:hypothetical protein
MTWMHVALDNFGSKLLRVDIGTALFQAGAVLATGASA